MTSSNPQPGSARLSSLWRLRAYVRPYTWYVVLMIAAGLTGSLIDIVVPLLVQHLIDGPVAHGNTRGLWVIGALALVYAACEWILVFLRRWSDSNGALGIETDLRDDVYRRLQRLPLEFHDRWPSGQLVSRMTSDITAIRRFVSFSFVFLVINIVTLIVVGVVLIVIDPLLGGIVVVCAVPLGVLTTRCQRRYKTTIRAVQQQQGNLATAVEESALGIKSIKAFGRQDLVCDEYDEKARHLRDLQGRQVRALGAMWNVITTQPIVVMSLIVLFGAIAVEEGTLSLGTLVAFVALFQLTLWPVQSLGWLLASVQDASSSADRVYQVLDAPLAASTAASTAASGTGDPDAAPAPGQPSPGADGGRSRLPAGRRSAAPARGARLAFDNLSFRYPLGDKDVLRGLDLVVEPGETVAVVGPTGCGKTTLTALVPRLYDVTGGRVTLGGRDVRRLPLAELRGRVACAFEDPTLLSASVRENVVMGRRGAGDDEVREALAVAQAGFVDDLPWGLDTRIGEQGTMLSGGQRQRLALARAVLGRPEVLVLDDPLSALDVATEGLVEAALREVLAGTTSLIVAHRPSTVLLADRVALLSGGRIEAIGTHQSLMRDVPEYRDLLALRSDRDELLEPEEA
jgi:ATP-binding cassette subfamily B protein